MIAQILQYAHVYDLDGINLDFENVYLDDKERLVQFVRELTPYLARAGIDRVDGCHDQIEQRQMVPFL